MTRPGRPDDPPPVPYAVSEEAGDMAAVIATATAAAIPVEMDEDRLYAQVVPEGAELEVVDLERFRPNPDRKKGTVTLYTSASLTAYVTRHGAKGLSSLYADIESNRIVAVLDDHQTDGPAGWREHRALLVLRHPPAWKRWFGQNNVSMGQVAFAEHVEEGLEEITTPPAADMLELAQTFQANTKVNFRSDNWLDSGQRRLVYEETVEAKAGQRGQIDVPREFMLSLEPFEGSSPYAVKARLRYRVREGTLNVGYTLDRPEEVLRTAFDEIVAAAEAATGVDAYRGVPG